MQLQPGNQCGVSPVGDYRHRAKRFGNQPRKPRLPGGINRRGGHGFQGEAVRGLSCSLRQSAKVGQKPAQEALLDGRTIQPGGQAAGDVDGKTA